MKDFKYQYYMFKPQPFRESGVMLLVDMAKQNIFIHAGHLQRTLSSQLNYSSPPHAHGSISVPS